MLITNSKMVFERDIWQNIQQFIDLPEAIVITGMRRVGKTTLLHYISNQLESNNKLFLDLQNPLHRALFDEVNYDTIPKKLIAEGLDFTTQTYLFLDEIQLLPSIPSVVKYLLDHYKIKFFLTGSASYYLKNLFSESLSGRKFIFELYPLSFKEFIRFKEARLKPPTIKEVSTEFTWEQFNPLWQEYFTFGAFPEIAVVSSPEEKEKKLADIFTSYFQNEIEQLSDFRKIDQLRDFIILLAENTGSLLNLNRISKELGIYRATLDNWLSFLQATYLVYLVPPYSKKHRVSSRKAKKVYFADWALASKLAEITAGQRLENCVHHLLKLKGQVSYYRKRSGAEIDFILNKKTAFEVKRKALKTDETKLKHLSSELELENYYLISEKFSPLSSAKPPFVIG